MLKRGAQTTTREGGKWFKKGGHMDKELLEWVRETVYDSTYNFEEYWCWTTDRLEKEIKKEPLKYIKILRNIIEEEKHYEDI